MKMSKLAIRTSKTRGMEETISQEILFQSGLIKRHSAGLYSMGHLLVKAQNKMEALLRDKLTEAECAEFSFSTLQPEQLWKESGRWDLYKESRQMFTLSDRKGNAYCLGPTHEEVVVDYLRNILVSYKNLPVNVFQISKKYRDEIRTRGGLMRSKEFLMADGYSFHANAEDMMEEYLKMKNVYMAFFAELGLLALPVKAANAEMGGRVSEEFMVICDVGENKLLYDKVYNMGLNAELLENPHMMEDLRGNYPELVFEKLEKKPCVEVGHIFQLGTHYSEKMCAYFTDVVGKKVPYFMGCYGIGLSRSLATCLELNCDKDGLNWPEKIAPYLAVIVSVEEREEEALRVYELLRKNRVEVLLEDRPLRFAEKLKDARLLGIPYLLILGKNGMRGKVELEKRKNGKKIEMDVESIIRYLRGY